MRLQFTTSEERKLQEVIENFREVFMRLADGMEKATKAGMELERQLRAEEAVFIERRKAELEYQAWLDTLNDPNFQASEK